MSSTKADLELEEHRRQVERLLSQAPWILRITEYKDKPSPVFVVKERLVPAENDSRDEDSSYLQDRGLIYGEALRCCLLILRSIVSRVCDQQGTPLELQRLLPGSQIFFRGNLPLDEEAGCKLALIFRLQERVPQMDRVELIARRVERFTREEAAYWHSRTTNFGEAANRWAIAGARLMLGGQPEDPAVQRMLEQLRHPC